MDTTGPRISYAQHWEDVRLWRVLRHLEPGFYVDVGAMDPLEDSVTKFAYDRGWHGVDVEPNPVFAAALRRHRDRDVVLEAAASDAEGTTALTVVRGAEGDTGLSTVDARYAAMHADAGRELVPVEVRTLRLADALAGTEAEDPARFHFLKVDVEGHEAAAIRGVDLGRFRPLVVVMEAREPDSPAPAYAEAEALLTAAGYAVAADDGLNRWYVRADRLELVEVLRIEPNPITDGHWRRIDDVRREDALEERVKELDTAIEGLHAELELARAEAAKVEGMQREIDRLAEHVREMEGSRSWRVTAPLRAAHRSLARSRTEEEG